MKENIVERILSQPWSISKEYALSYSFAVANLLQGKETFAPLSVKAWKKRNRTLFVAAGKTTAFWDDDPSDDEDGNDELIDDTPDLDTSDDETEQIETGSVALVRLNGPVLKYSQLCGPRGTLSIANELDQLANDTNVIGAVFDIESGGGEVFAVKPLADAIKRFRAKKPIVTLAGDLLCSAAYYLSVFTNEIYFDHPKAMIGCIGTKITWADFKPALEKQGVVFHDIYATASTLKNKVENDAEEGDYKPMIEQRLNPFNLDFTNDVTAERGERLSNDKRILAGEIFFGTDALALGMVDKQGNRADAITRVRQLAVKYPSNSPKQSNMNFPKIFSLKGLNNPTQEQLDVANAELTASGITGVGLYPESLVTEAATATAANAKLTADLATANTALATSNTTLTATQSSLTAATTKIAELEAKIDAFGKNAGAVHKGANGKDVAAAQSEEDREAALAAMPHNKAADNMWGAPKA